MVGFGGVGKTTFKRAAVGQEASKYHASLIGGLKDAARRSGPRLGTQRGDEWARRHRLLAANGVAGADLAVFLRRRR